MITTARQLKDLIRNLSKKKSADAQILMRNYINPPGRWCLVSDQTDIRNHGRSRLSWCSCKHVLQFSKNVEKPNDGTTKQGKELHHE